MHVHGSDMYGLGGYFQDMYLEYLDWLRYATNKYCHFAISLARVKPYGGGLVLLVLLVDGAASVEAAPSTSFHLYRCMITNRGWKWKWKWKDRPGLRRHTIRTKYE